MIVSAVRRRPYTIAIWDNPFKNPNVTSAASKVRPISIGLFANKAI